MAWTEESKCARMSLPLYALIAVGALAWHTKASCPKPYTANKIRLVNVYSVRFDTFRYILYIPIRFHG